MGIDGYQAGRARGQGGTVKGRGDDAGDSEQRRRDSQTVSQSANQTLRHKLSADPERAQGPLNHQAKLQGSGRLLSGSAESLRGGPSVPLKAEVHRYGGTRADLADLAEGRGQRAQGTWACSQRALGACLLAWLLALYLLGAERAHG